jgi:23S rRNA (uridine2552-2'-O)-methyltransferase
LVVGVDRTPLSVSIPGHGRFVERDVFECEIENLRNITMEYDVVLSDLAPKTTGNREGDHERSFELCAQAFKVATGVLRSGGNFVCKMYQGPRSKEFLEMLRKVFENCKTQKPSASRSESRELFFVALEFTSAKD